MKETERIRDELQRSLEGDAWHGVPLTRLLEGVPAPTAAARPIPGGHTIWELVVHVTAWVREVARRLDGGVPWIPPEADWPEVKETGEAAWQAVVADLRTAHEELRAALARFPEERLDEVVGGERDAPLGVGVSWHVVLHGVAQHNAYHAGQVALLKKEIEKGYHHRLAVTAFNRVWQLMDKSDRTPAEDAEMLHLAHASRHHWGRIGEPVHLARGEWQVARVYCVLGRAEPALYHARLCLEITEANGIGDFDLAFAYEGMARVAALAGDADTSRAWLEKARGAAAAIASEEDRKIVWGDLATIDGAQA
jgi:uncharacterized damage-inducible protein DinB